MQAKSYLESLQLQTRDSVAIPQSSSSSSSSPFLSSDFAKQTYNNRSSLLPSPPPPTSRKQYLPSASPLGPLATHVDDIFFLHHRTRGNSSSTVHMLLDQLGATDAKLVVDFDVRDVGSLQQQQQLRRCMDWTLTTPPLPSPRDDEVINPVRLPWQSLRYEVHGRKRGAGLRSLVRGDRARRPPQDIEIAALLKTFAAHYYMLAANLSRVLVVADDAGLGGHAYDGKGGIGSATAGSVEDLVDVFKVIPRNAPFVMLGQGMATGDIEHGEGMVPLGQQFFVSDMLHGWGSAAGLSLQTNRVAEEERRAREESFQNWKSAGSIRILQNHVSAQISQTYAITKAGAILSFKSFPIRWPLDLQLNSVEIRTGTHIGGARHPDWRMYHVIPPIFYRHYRHS